MSNPSNYALRGRTANDPADLAALLGANPAPHAKDASLPANLYADALVHPSLLLVAHDIEDSANPLANDASDEFVYHEGTKASTDEDAAEGNSSLKDANPSTASNGSDHTKDAHPTPTPQDPLVTSILSPAAVPFVAASPNLAALVLQLAESQKALVQAQLDKIKQDTALETQRLKNELLLAATKKHDKQPRDGKQVAAKPKKFDGTDPRKLNDFLTANKLCFISAPRSFLTETNKVVAAASFLEGVPFNWFRNQMNKVRKDPSLAPAWYSNYKLFSEILKAKFGPKDLIATADRKVRSIRFGKGVTDYTNRFDEIADRLHWNNDALFSEYKLLLPRHLKTAINARKRRLKTLEELQDLALDVKDRLAEDANDCQTNFGRRTVATATPAKPKVAKVTATLRTSSTPSLKDSSRKVEPKAPNPNLDAGSAATAASTSLARTAPRRRTGARKWFGQ